jgi:hypothetical protein
LIAEATSPGPISSLPRSFSRIAQVVAGLLEHARDEVVELGERLGRILAELLLERLHLAHPRVLVEPWFEHRLLVCAGAANLKHSAA